MTTNVARQHNRIDLIVTGRYDEIRADVAGLRPGTVIAVNADGKGIVHSTAGVCYEVIVVLQAQKAGANVDTAYEDEALLPVIYPAIGDVLAMQLESAQECGPDDFLTVTNTGTLKVATSTDHRLFRPLDTLDGTGSGDRFVRVRRVA